MEDGVAFLESSGVLNQVRQLGIATTHWEEAVLAFRSTSHTPSTPKLNYSKQVHIPPSKLKLNCSKPREVAEQFDAFALEVAADRPENLRLINDQVNPQNSLIFSDVLSTQQRTT